MTPDFDILERGSSQAPTLNQLGNLLIEYNPETEDTLDIRGDLATSWDLSADGTSYTFFLNPKAKWHDGVPVTAADVKWTLDISAFPPEGETRHSLAFFKPFYESSQVIDDNTVRVNSKFPSPAFFQYLAMNYHQILPKHHYEGMSAEDRDFEENFLGSGPFFLTEFERGVGNSYERNPDYWKEGLPYLDALEYFLVTPGGTMIAAYKTGQVHMSRSPLSGLSNVEALALADDVEGEGQVLWGGPISQISLYFDLSSPPFDDVRVRRAIHLATHRQPFIEILTLGQATMGYPFPPGYWFSITEEEVAKLPGYRELNGEKHPDDIAAAQRLMAEAGLADGFSREMMVFDQSGLVEVGQIAADQLRRTLKIETKVDVVEHATALARLKVDDWEFLGWSEGTNMLDPEDAFARLYLSGAPQNFGGYENARIDELYDLQARSLDQDKRRAWTMEAANIILDEVPYITLYWVDRPMFVHNSVKNFNMPDIWYALNHKMEHLWCDPVCS